MAIRRVRIDPAKLAVPQYSSVDRYRLFQESKEVAQEKIANSKTAPILPIRDKLQNRGLTLNMNDLIGVPSQGPVLDRHDLFQGMDNQMLTEEFPTSHDNIIMEDLYSGRRTEPVRQVQPSRQLQRQKQPQRPIQPQKQSLREQVLAPVRQENNLSPWGVKAFIAETKGGNQVPVWKVLNTKTKFIIETIFRIEDIAHRVVAFLNDSGDTNDPRALSLVNAYNKRDSLLKEVRLLEKSADGKPMKTQRLQQIRSEISQLDYRLGI